MKLQRRVANREDRLMRNFFRILSATALGAVFAASPGAAQSEWPTSSDRINIIVPFDTGGSTDRLARHIATNLSPYLNDAPVTVVNRPGASGAVGSAYLLSQPADGTNFLVTHAVPYLANNVLTSGLPMVWEDFTPVNIQWPQSSLLFVGSESGFETLPELIESIRENPGEHSAAVLAGSGAYLQLQLMMEELDIPVENVRWITYEGGGPQRSAVAGGNVTFALSAAEGTLGMADLVTPLAIHAEGGDPAWPGVPYLNDVLEAEYGITVPGVGNTYASLIAPTAFRDEFPERWETFVNAYREMVESEEYQSAAAEASFGSTYFGPERSAEILDEGYAVMARFAEDGSAD
jgi:putative tricarboxylic transport membrane protein